MIGFDYADVHIFQSYHNLVRNLNVYFHAITTLAISKKKYSKLFWPTPTTKPNGYGGGIFATRSNLSHYLSPCHGRWTVSTWGNSLYSTKS